MIKNKKQPVSFSGYKYMTKNSEEKKPHQLPFELMGKVCSVIQDTGYLGSADDYIKEFYGKPFAELTVCEAEMIVRNLSGKEGCLYGTKEDGHDQSTKEKGL